jgi:hypothetical protein
MKYLMWGSVVLYTGLALFEAYGIDVKNDTVHFSAFLCLLFGIMAGSNSVLASSYKPEKSKPKPMIST